jgi:flavorubredoxin
MPCPYKAIPLNDHVWWVGAIDWNLRDFHGYTTELGSTYNAYLIIDDHCTLIDTVKRPFMDEMISRISSVIDPGKIEYIVCNHTEMDHSGALPEVIQRINPDKVFASALGIKALNNHFSLKMDITGVKDGEIVSLGHRKLQFFETRMIHWPESMFTYLTEDAILFSNDAFGMHMASSARFDDQLNLSVLQYQGAKYYANILLPYCALIKRLMEKIPTLGLSFKMIAPDHGPVWRSHIDEIIKWYISWSNRELTDKAVVVYDTMWESTAMMARAITEGLSDGGLNPLLFCMHASNRSDVTTQVLDSKALVVGSPTLNNNLFPSVADVLTYLKGLRPDKLTAGSFGSYGWSGEATGQINQYFNDMKLRLVGQGIKALYIPNENVLRNCYDYGRQIAELSKAIS